MFAGEQREQVRERVLELVQPDARVTGAALTGSGAAGTADRWFAIDLGFGIADGTNLAAVLADWTALFYVHAAIERGQPWRVEYWIRSLRSHAGPGLPAPGRERRRGAGDRSPPRRHHRAAGRRARPLAGLPGVTAGAGHGDHLVAGRTGGLGWRLMRQADPPPGGVRGTPRSESGF